MTKIKICGITNLNDALAAADAGADLLGFNFYLKSPRQIEVGLCRGITSKLRNRYAQIVFVGVFVNLPASEVYATLETCGLALAQLHGDETPEMLAALGGRAFKAFRGAARLESDQRMIADHAPAFLLDAAVKDAYGGTGVTADWLAAAALAKKYPLLLAGGLTPENVDEAVRQVQPWGVDVASGVEVSPGVKDFGKMKLFVKAVRLSENP